MATLALLVLAAPPVPGAPPDREPDKACTSAEFEYGRDELGKPKPNIRAAFDRLSKGIEALEEIDGPGGQRCRSALAEAYVYLAACVWRIAAVEPIPPLGLETLVLTETGFKRLQVHTVHGALEHAAILDHARARQAVDRLRASGVIDATLTDKYNRAEAFVDKVAPPPGRVREHALLPRWLVLAAGVFMARQPHRGDAPMFGPYAFVGVGQRRGLSAGPVLGWSFGGGSTPVVGLGVHYTPLRRAAITVAFGWRLPADTGERTLHGLGVGASYQVTGL